MPCDSRSHNSDFPPVCCVHKDGAKGDVLGHHYHQEQEEGLPEYQINFNDETKRGLDPVPTYQTNAKTKTARRAKAKRFLLAAIAISGFIYLAYTHVFAFFKKNNSILPMMDPKDEDCYIRSIDYDGPSQFKIDAQNVELYLGPGNYKAEVNVFADPNIETAEIRLRGTVSPDLSLAQKKKKIQKLKEDVDIEHQYVNIKIIESDGNLDASIWYQDHETEDEWGHPYKACARLEIDVVIPEGVRFGKLSIEGNAAHINTHDLSTVGFEELYLGAKVGSVSTKEVVRTDSLDIELVTGKITVEAVKAATLGKPLDVSATTKTGYVLVNALTNNVDESSEHHSIKTETTTGGIQLAVQPDEENDDFTRSFSYPGNILIKAKTVKGSIKARVDLSDEDQHLELNGETKTGSIYGRVSDVYSGFFDLKTKSGAIHVSQDPSSTSVIEYKVDQKKVKEGTKTTKDGEKVSQGNVQLNTGSGSVSLLFFRPE